jgi:hypothetical protein
MAQYDPQRSRSRHRSGEDEGPAPVDALLGPIGSPDPAESPDLIDLTDAAARSGSVGDAAAVDGAGGPSVGSAPLKPVVLVLAVLAGMVLAWAWTRRRRTPPTTD